MKFHECNAHTNNVLPLMGNKRFAWRGGKTTQAMSRKIFWQQVKKIDKTAHQGEREREKKQRK